MAGGGWGERGWWQEIKVPGDLLRGRLGREGSDLPILFSFLSSLFE